MFWSSDAVLVWRPFLGQGRGSPRAIAQLPFVGDPCRPGFRPIGRLVCGCPTGQTSGSAL
eukprot:10354443-Lingulodinium_polyedra.AAC.1